MNLIKGAIKNGPTEGSKWCSVLYIIAYMPLFLYDTPLLPSEKYCHELSKNILVWVKDCPRTILAVQDNDREWCTAVVMVRTVFYADAIRLKVLCDEGQLGGPG